MKFFDRLYLGFEAEYYVMGQLFGTGYEGFKMPADFGFDVLVTNQKKQSLSPNAIDRRVLPPPYALQVKSRRIGGADLCEGPNGRPEVVVDFAIKEDELNLIISEKNTYLVCVVFLNDFQTSPSGKVLYFWLHSLHLQDLKEKGYLRQETISVNKRRYVLKSCIRLLPTVNTKSIFEKLVEQGDLTEKGRRHLLSVLPENLPMSWNASEYISLMRPARNQSGEEVAKPIPDTLRTFKNLGKQVELSYID